MTKGQSVYDDFIYDHRKITQGQLVYDDFIHAHQYTEDDKLCVVIT